MEQELFYEFCPKRGRQNNKAILFSSGLGAVKDVIGVKKTFKHFDLDFHYFDRNDMLIAERFGGVRVLFDAFCEFIQKIDEKGYDELILFGKSFGGFLQLLAMQEIAIENIKTQIKIVCAPAFIDPSQLVEEGNIILPDGKTSIKIDETNELFFVDHVVQKVSHDTLLLIGENDNAQDLNGLKEFEEQNKENVTLKVMKEADHFNLLNRMESVYQIMKCLEIYK